MGLSRCACAKNVDVTSIPQRLFGGGVGGGVGACVELLPGNVRALGQIDLRKAESPVCSRWKSCANLLKIGCFAPVWGFWMHFWIRAAELM